MTDMSRYRVVSAELDGVVHRALIESADTDILEAPVGPVPVKLPVRLLCEVRVHGLSARSPGRVMSLPCTDADTTCMACIAA